MPAISATVRVEVGTRSGNYPTEVRAIQSFVGAMLGEALGDEITDLTAFSMTLLHFRRTFVEKLFTIHSEVHELMSEGTPLGRHCRHYADLYVLASQDSVIEMLASDEYHGICTDYDTVSRAEFADRYHPPNGLSLSTSEGIFIADDVMESIRSDYDAQCRLLFYETPPTFEDVIGRLKELAPQL